MLDPVTIGTAVQVASSAFSMLQKGFAAGRELEQMSADLSRWMSAVSDVDHLQKTAKNPSLFLKLTKGKSIESLALEAFTAKKKLEDQRYQLKQMIQLTRGTAAWNELLALEGSIRKQRQEAVYAAQQRRQKFVEIVAWIFMGLLAAGLLTGFVLLLKGHAARAQPEHVLCRLVGCDKIDGMRYCVYRGAWNTQEVISFRMDEWFPREFLCDFEPDKPRPPSMRETLKAIRESQR